MFLKISASSPEASAQIHESVDISTKPHTERGKKPAWREAAVRCHPSWPRGTARKNAFEFLTASRALKKRQTDRQTQGAQEQQTATCEGAAAGG